MIAGSKVQIGIRACTKCLLNLGPAKNRWSIYFLKTTVNGVATIGMECLIAVILFVIAYGVFQWGTHSYESAGN